MQFKLDKKSLEIIYTSFIRPILEYGDIIGANCAKNELYELDKIQNECVGIATASTKLAHLTVYKQKLVGKV
jgi:hypothetical protein